MRIFLAFIIISLFTLGVSGQTEIDSTYSELPSIIQYHLKHENLSINDIEIDKNNRVIVATDQMLLTIGNTKESELTYLQNTYLSCAIADHKNNLYGAGKNHLYIVATGQKVSIEDPDVIISDLAYKSGRLWLATNKGLYTYAISSGTWRPYTTENSKLKSNIINFVQVDDKDVLWVGTTKGYIKIEGEEWEVQDKKYNIVSSRFNNEGQWMVATEDMWLIDPFNRKYPVGLDKDLFKGEINDFVIDSKGRIYMASEILVRYNPYKEEVEKYGEDVGLLSQKCLSLACDKNNNIWIGTADAGLFRFAFDDIVKEQLSSTILLARNVSCNEGNDASLKVTTAGGTKPYKYKWSDSRLRGVNPNSVGPGSYAVTVSDRFGSQYISEITVKAPAPISIEVGEITRVTGFGNKDGTALISASGGSGKLAYKWSNGSEEMNLTKVGPGIYTVSVVDENNCMSEETVTIKKEKYIPELDITKVGIGQTLRINELSFDADSTVLNPESFEILDEVYDFLMEQGKVVVEIGGHTNTIPPHEYCDKLSTDRARSVAEYIVAKGIDPSRVSYKGYGKREPLTESQSSQARKKNQRVEVKILSL